MEKPIKSVIFLVIHYISTIAAYDNDEFSGFINLNCRADKIKTGWKS